MHFLASVYFSAQVPGVVLRLPQAQPAGPGSSRPITEQLALSLAGLAIKQQFCLVRKDVFCWQPPGAACSHTCPIVSGWSAISKSRSPLPEPCRSQLLWIPSQRRLRWVSFLPSREIFDRCLLLFHGPVLLCFSSEVQDIRFCSFPITEQ